MPITHEIPCILAGKAHSHLRLDWSHGTMLYNLGDRIQFPNLLWRELSERRGKRMNSVSNWHTVKAAAGSTVSVYSYSIASWIELSRIPNYIQTLLQQAEEGTFCNLLYFTQSVVHTYLAYRFSLL